VPKKPPVDPKQLAVALKYDPAPDASPEVVATGRGAVAEQILQLAFSEGIKVREDADLVQILSVLEIGEEIPVETFAAIAEILTYVYRANNKAFPDDDPLDAPNPNSSPKSVQEILP